MFSSNGFNVCPHCGKANSLNARYCSSCGKQLLTPQEVVVCYRCRKTNSPSASFCGACGAPLRINAKTKICPKCHREIDISANVCSCGYDFAPVQYTAPAANVKPVEQKPAKAAETKPAKKEAVANGVKPMYNHKGGRAVAVVILVIMLLMAFLVLTPYYQYKDGQIVIDDNGEPKTIRFDFLANNDKGIMYATGPQDEVYPMYGVEILQSVVSAFKNSEEGSEMTPIQMLQDVYGVGGLALAAMIALFLLAVLVQLAVCIIRFVTGKRGKHINYLYLALAVLTTLWTLLGFFIGKYVDPTKEGFLVTLYNIFVPTEYFVGYVAFVIPFYFWLMFTISATGKARKVKEKVA